MGQRTDWWVCLLLDYLHQVIRLGGAILSINAVTEVKLAYKMREVYTEAKYLLKYKMYNYPIKSQVVTTEYI